MELGRISKILEFRIEINGVKASTHTDDYKKRLYKREYETFSVK